MSDAEFNARAQELIEAGQILYEQGLVPATSGNFSARLAQGDIAITVSGKHKGKLTPDDIMRVNSTGQSYDQRTPSAETGLHLQIYQRVPDSGVILHPHGINATLVSRTLAGDLHLSGYELLKAFPSIKSHDVEITIPVFENSQDIGALAQRVDAYFEKTNAPIVGYLIRSHGFYTWGQSVADTLRHVEALNFLFECEFRLQGAGIR